MTKALLFVTVIFLLFAFTASAFLAAKYIDKLRKCHRGAEDIHCHWVWEDPHTHLEQ
jgi:hypothetical protein